MLHRLLKIIFPLLLLISITAKAVNTAIEDPKPTKRTALSKSKKTKNNRTKSYRLDYNGKETDQESGLQDYGMRMNDVRIAKFLSVDPLTKEYPMLTPYQFASNTPISSIDIDGLEAGYYVSVFNAKTGKSQMKLEHAEGNLFDWVLPGTALYIKTSQDEEPVYISHYGSDFFSAVDSWEGLTEDQFSAKIEAVLAEQEAHAEKVKQRNAEIDEMTATMAGLKYGQSRQKVKSKSPSQKSQISSNSGVTANGKKLNWTAVVPQKGKYKGQSREDHVRLHNKDNKLKPDHGIFNGDGVSITNQAWEKAQSLNLQPDANGMLVVPFPNAGKSGGANGNGSNLNNITIYVVPGTENIITSFPSN